MIGYWFFGDTLRDGRPVPPDGEWLEYEGPVVPCASGLHCSEHPSDALRYAPGYNLALVELEGDLTPHGNPVDKWAGRRRRSLKRINAERLLRRFAADQALAVAHLWDMPAVVREYLTALDPTLREAASEAAWAASEAAQTATWSTRAAAQTASEAAAQTATWAATWSTRAAAQTAAWAASEAASGAAARAASEAARAAAREEFARRIRDAFGEGAP